MSEGKIKFVISTIGDVEIKDVCGHGSSCKEISESYEKILGDAVESTREHTDEYEELTQENVTTQNQ